MKTPDEEVAERIVQQLCAAGLLSRDGAKKLFPELVTGRFKAEDWKFLIETNGLTTEDADAAQNQ